MNSLASAYRQKGRIREALPLQEAVVRLRRKTSGPEHPNKVYAMGELAASYQALQQVDKALPLREEVLRARKLKLGRDYQTPLDATAALCMQTGLPPLLLRPSVVTSRRRLCR